MNKRLLILVAILIILIVILTTMGIFSFLNKDNQKSAETRNNLSLERAESAAQEFTAKQAGSQSSDLVIQPEKTQTKDFGYVFFFTTKKYLATGDPSQLIPGIGPVIVEYAGKVFSISSSVDPAKAIDEYEQQFNKTQQ